MNTLTERISRTACEILVAALFAIALAVITLPASAATWNDGPGIGDNGDGYFSASGVPMSVIQSVRSNTTYVIVGGERSVGAPLVQSITVKPDFVTGALEFWVPTNYWTTASNQPAGTNIIWLASTNSGLATNDLLILEDVDGTAQLLVLSGNATDSGGLVYTNGAGYNAVKVFTTPTNTITAGSKLWKLARRKTLTPLALHAITNDLVAPWNNYWGLAGRNWTVTFAGEVGKPAAITMTYSNAADIQVDGVLKKRELY